MKLRNKVSEYTAHNSLDIDNYLEQLSENYAQLTNPISVYDRVIQAIISNPNLHVCLMKDFEANLEDDLTWVSLRHDIDANPVMGVKLAKRLQDYGLPGSFYVLHTAIYYGQFFDKSFVRTPQISKWVQDLVSTGCEVGIHNDAIGVFVNNQVDGINALATEIDWLRSQGAEVCGSVAHNSFPTYGAENFEIFEECVLLKRKIDQGVPNNILGSVKQCSLGLTYEGNFCSSNMFKESSAELREFLDIAPDIRSDSWMRRYLHNNPYMSKRYDCDIWLVGQDHWVVSQRFGNNSYFSSRVDTDGVLLLLGSLPKLSKTVITLHPEYFH